MNRLKWSLLALVFGMKLVLAQVVIHEVFYDPEGSDTGAEWIELKNTGVEAVSLEGWLVDASGPNLVLPAVSLPAGELLLLHTNAESAQPPQGFELWYDAANMGNTHGFVGLWSTDQQQVDCLVDYMEYGQAGHSWESQAVEAGLWVVDGFATDVESGQSLLRTSAGYTPAAWSAELNPEPGNSNTALAEPEAEIEGFGLESVWPNPFNPSCTVRFRVDQPGAARLVLYDLLGHQLSVLHEERLSSGDYERSIDLSERPAAPYLLALEGSGQRSITRITLLK